MYLFFVLWTRIYLQLLWEYLFDLPTRTFLKAGTAALATPLVRKALAVEVLILGHAAVFVIAPPLSGRRRDILAVRQR